MAKGQQKNGPTTPMRPNIDITHTLNGRVKDYAAEHDLSLPEAYSRIIETGLADLEARDEETRGQQDSQTVGQEDTRAREDSTDDRVEEIVAEVSASWDDAEEKLQARRGAARAALELAAERGVLSRGDAVDALLPAFSVPEQSEETWWRKNVRPVLQEAGEHVTGRGYSVDLDGD